MSVACPGYYTILHEFTIVHATLTHQVTRSHKPFASLPTGVASRDTILGPGKSRKSPNQYHSVRVKNDLAFETRLACTCEFRIRVGRTEILDYEPGTTVSSQAIM